jgi:hypothetical protein
MKLQDYINGQFESVDNEGISKIQLNAEVKDFEVARNDENIKVLKVRFEGYNDQTSHPELREPRTDGWFTLRFDNDGEWFFYDYE